jgi:hypothetical protein
MDINIIVNNLYIQKLEALRIATGLCILRSRWSDLKRQKRTQNILEQTSLNQFRLVLRLVAGGLGVVRLQLLAVVVVTVVVTVVVRVVVKIMVMVLVLVVVVIVVMVTRVMMVMVMALIE